LEGRWGSSRCDFWSRGQSAGVSKISHTTTSTPDAAIASPDMGGCPPWRLHRVWAPGSDVARAGYDPQGCKSGQKQRSQSCLEVSELPRSLRAASKSAERSALLLAALGGLSCQLSARQPRAAPCRACRRGCCARWPQRWSTTGTATVLALELVHTTTCQALVSIDVSWSSCVGRGH
jgi:hypothetical protein